MKLIDADELVVRLRNDPLFDLVEQYGLTRVIEAQPTVNAVPVIRCKDCKYYRWEIDMCDEQHSSAHNIVHEDDYCSRAERKEE